MKTVKFFKNAQGKSPVEEFLDSLTFEQAKKIVWAMRLLERLDNVPSTYLKKLEATDGILEIRAQESSMAFRILGFFEENYFIATNGFIKKTQKRHRTKLGLRVRENKSIYQEVTTNE